MENCIYCECEISNSSNEHVLPNAIGGTATIKGVCKKCNNGFLSQLDEQLCSFSPLSIISAQELDDSSIHSLWTTDISANGLLIESFYDNRTDSLVAYPQLIVESNHYHLRAPLEDMKRIGIAGVKKILIRRLSEAFDKHELRVVSSEPRRIKPAIINQKIEKGIIASDRRFPPRFFFRCTLDELIKKPSTLILRYLEDSDFKLAFNRLSKLRYTASFRRSSETWTSNVASVKLEFVQTMVSRALMKISLNAIKFVVEKTIVDKTNFKETIEIIRGNLVEDIYLKQASGFINPLKASAINSQVNEHNLWIIREKEYWIVFIAFFGGRIVSKSVLKGSSNEDWSFAELTIPIKSNKVKIKRHILYPPVIKAPIIWNNLEDIIPSGKLSEGKFEERRVRKKTK